MRIVCGTKLLGYYEHRTTDKTGLWIESECWPKEGDVLRMEREDGTIARYRVDEIEWSMRKVDGESIRLEPEIVWVYRIKVGTPTQNKPRPRVRVQDPSWEQKRGKLGSR